MADPRIARRDLLKVAAAIGGAGAIGFSAWRLTPAASDLADCVADNGAGADCYEPRILSRGQFEILDAITELIIPEDETPGARAAGVAEFIDFYASRNETLTDRLRTALDWFDARAEKQAAPSFIRLDEPGQVNLLQSVAGGSGEGAAHFEFLKEHTVLGFYSSEIGWRELSSPFLRPAYAYEELPGYPHED